MGSLRSSANSRSTASRSYRPSPAARRRTTGRRDSGHVRTELTIAPTGCSPARSRSRTNSIHVARASPAARSLSAVSDLDRREPNQTAPPVTSAAGTHPDRIATTQAVRSAATERIRSR
jgi:hypothetical protein